MSIRKIFMIYRKLKRGGEEISIIGMGAASIGLSTEKEAIETIDSALKAGINYFDLAAGHSTVFPYYGKAFENRRKEAYFQIHFGADYTSGEYGWTLDLDKIKHSIDWQLKKLKTDYIDFGFIHCMDEEDDFIRYKKNGVLDYILSLKEKGIVKHVGLSSHTPSVVNKILDLGIVDMLMFSINALYDEGIGEYAHGEKKERSELYLRCEREGIGISVMKPFAGGMLLDERKSPFKKALSRIQCMEYALSRPGVLTVLPGCANKGELEDVLKYLDAPYCERDYSMIADFKKEEGEPSCVYCQHCHPCPIGLNIALINKYYDLALLGDNLAREHYMTLEKKAGECIKCHHCDKRCPFKVRQSERMGRIAKYFGA